MSRQLDYLHADFRPKKGKVRKFVERYRDEIILAAVAAVVLAAVAYVSTRGLDRQIEKAGEYADRVAEMNWGGEL